MKQGLLYAGGKHDPQSLRQVGKYSEAEDMYRKALQLYTRIKGIRVKVAWLLRLCSFDHTPPHVAYTGKQHQDTAAAMNNLGMALSQVEKHDEAEKLCNEALMIYERVLGKDHPSSLASVEKLASILQVWSGQGVQ